MMDLPKPRLRNLVGTDVRKALASTTPSLAMSHTVTQLTVLIAKFLQLYHRRSTQVLRILGYALQGALAFFLVLISRVLF